MLFFYFIQINYFYFFFEIFIYYYYIKMANILYHSSRPLNDNQQNGFIEFDSIDFEIQDMGRKLMKNSVYIEADIEVFKSTGTPVGKTDKIGINNNVGFHSFFESFSVDAKGQNIQNVQSYPKYVNIVNTASSNIGSVFTPASQAAGIQCTEEAARYVIQPVSASHVNGTNPKTTVKRAVQLCCKPKIVLNSMMGDDYSFEKNGSIRVSCNLARNGTVLYGGDCVATSSYTLKNVRLKYMTVLDDGKQGEILMNSVVSVKQSINSEQANLSVKVPSKAVTGVVMTYISQANETSLVKDSIKLENIPNLDEIVYLFSDSMSKFVSFSLTDKDDMLQKGIEALSASGVKCKVNSFQARNNQNVIHGLNFQSTVDLTNQKFGVNLRSSSNKIATNPRNVYMHFLTIVSM